MTDLLNQALTLTVWGMGMTFTAIGALVLGMVLITAWSGDKAKAHPEREESFEAKPEADIDVGQTDLEHNGIEDHVYVPNVEELNMAAAAGVAVALALMQESASQQNRTPAPDAVQSAWSYFVRGRHLSQRSYFAQRNRK